MSGGPAPRPVRAAVPLAALLLAAASSGSAHDLWIVPGKYRLQPNEATRVFINSGDGFPESLTLLGKHRLTEVWVRSSAGELAIEDFRVDGRSLTFELQSSAEGVHVLALGTRPRTIRMKAEDFEDYLKEERLASIAAMRDELGETGQPAVERYAKWSKAIVDVGAGAAEEEGNPWSQPAGHPLEIVPLSHPNRVEPGSPLRVRVLFEGAPLAAAAIVGARAGGPAREIETSTDEAGEASVLLSAPGRWFLRALHAIRLQGDPDVQWESYWASLTFEVPAPDDRP